MSNMVNIDPVYWWTRVQCLTPISMEYPKFPWILISFPKKIAMAGCTSGLLYPIFRQIHIALTTKMWNVSSGMVLLVFVSGLEGLCLAYMDAVILSFFFWYIYMYIYWCRLYCICHTIHHNNAIHATLFSRYLWDVYAMGRALGKSPLQENVIVGDLARMVGVYGKSQEAGFKIGTCW